MSESPKMGLFGSKDETKEAKKDTKDESPDRYAPYCIDSDSETYDTEALSIMDINDIIGVQSEPVTDSTLESEIAALSQMITESKTDGSQNSTEMRCDMMDKDDDNLEEACMIENSDTVQIPVAIEDSKTTLEELEKVCCSEETASSNELETGTEKSQLNVESSLDQHLPLCEQQKDNDVTDHCKPNVLIDCVSNIETVKHSSGWNEAEAGSVGTIDDSISVTPEVVKSEEDVNKSDVDVQRDENKEATSVNNEAITTEEDKGVHKSLQLIGEAYSSENSRESSANNEEAKQMHLATSTNEEGLTLAEEKDEHCKLEVDVNNVSEKPDNTSCTDKGNNTVENQTVHTIEVDSSNCSIGPTEEELLVSSEDTEATISDKCKVNSPSNTVSKCVGETTSAVSTDTSSIQEEMLEDKKMKVEAEEDTATIGDAEMDLDEKVLDEKQDESVSDTCITDEEKYGAEITERDKETESNQEITRSTNAPKEDNLKDNDCVAEEKDTCEKENIENLKNEEEPNSVEDKEVTVDTEVHPKENELEVESTESEMVSKSIKDSASHETEQTNLETEDYTEVLKEKEELEPPQVSEEMKAEKVESMEVELEQDSIEPLTNCLVQETNDLVPMDSEKNYAVMPQKSTEMAFDNDDLIDNTTEINNVATNKEPEGKEEDNLNSVSSEVSRNELKDANIEQDSTESATMQENSENELEACTQISSDATLVCESLPTKDLSKQCVTPTIEIHTVAGNAGSEDAGVAEGNPKVKIAELLKEKKEQAIEEMEIEQMAEEEMEKSISQQQNQDLDQDERVGIKETETVGALDVINTLEQCAALENIETLQQVEEIRPTEHTESQATVPDQTVKEIPVESRTEDKDTIDEESEGNVMTQDQTKEKLTEIEKLLKDEVTMKDDVEKPQEDNVTVEEPAEENIMIGKPIEDNGVAEQLTEDNVIADKPTEDKAIAEDQAIIEEETEDKLMAEQEKQVDVAVEEQVKEEDAIAEQPIPEKKMQESEENESSIDAVKMATADTISSMQEENLEVQSEENTVSDDVEESISQLNEDLSTEPKVFKKDLLSPSEEIMVSEEDAREENIEEEMNLTLEPEETEAELEAVKAMEELENAERHAEFIEEIEKGQEESLVKADDDTIDSLNIDKSSIIDMEVDDTESSKNKEQQQLEDSNSKTDSSTENLKDILDTDNKVDEMFAEEQCQNTQDIVTSILDEESPATDFKDILRTGRDVANEIEDVLKQSESLPLAESEMEDLTGKLQQDTEDILSKDMDDTISNQNMDSLEGLLGLDLMQEGDDSTMKTEKSEEQLQKSEQLEKVVDMSLLLEQSNHTSDMTQASDYISHMISSCLTERNASLQADSTEKAETAEMEDDKAMDTETGDMLKANEPILSKRMSKKRTRQALRKELRDSADLPENDLDIDFEETPLESVDDMEESEEPKLELGSDILLQNDEGENLNDVPCGMETSQPSSEISELESAVKFLQESEEQAMDSPLVLSPKMVESVVDDISKQDAASSLFVADEDMCENTAELEAELQNIATDSISISEAEIISEAAKLESERKLAEQIKIDATKSKFEANDGKEVEVGRPMNQEDMIGATIPRVESTETKYAGKSLLNVQMQQQASNPSVEKIPQAIAALPQKVLKTTESIPKVSILEERLKEPPKIEIPSADVSKVAMSPTTSKDSLLIQKDAKLIAYQKMLESPKLAEKTEPKIVETPRKDSEKHDFENVGSPRIILKIAKSAITDCGEPRSPKSPKIRSATNSPNPEDSPGQKLGKIKLKLSKGGHPSIISNENVEEVGQWYTEGASSLSPIGMKIKLSKSGDASIVSSEKYDTVDDTKDSKHKYEDMKRTESPIGMKIKLSKTGDASIVQQDCKELQMKHKDKLDMIQGSPKRTESPIGMKIKLSKTGDASIIQPERSDTSEEHKDTVQMKSKEKLDCYDSPKRTDSPIGMKIKLSKTGDASIVSPDMPDESKESGKLKDACKFESPPEVPKRTESPIGMKIKLAKTKGGASIISVENSEESKDKLEVPDVPKRTESPLGMKIKLSKTGDASIVHSELADEVKEKGEAAQDTGKSSETSCGMRIKVIRSGEIQAVGQESLEQSMEGVQEPAPKVESPLGVKIKFSKFGDPSIVPTERQEQAEESRPLPETPKRTESPLGMKIKLSKTGDASIIQPETSDDSCKVGRTPEMEHSKASDAGLGMKIKLLKTGDASIVEPEKKERQLRRRDTETPLEMKIKLSKTGHPTIVACDNQDSMYKGKEATEATQNYTQRYKEPAPVAHKEPALKILKSGHSTILQSNRSELTIEPVQMQGKKLDSMVEIAPSKRKDITISPVDSKKSKLETQLTQILPEVTIQPVASREQKQFLFDPKNNSISLQQMNVINQEISITQVRPQKPMDPLMSEKLKDILSKKVSGSPMNPDCEIIEHRSELIIVSENSNSSQDVVIIEEVSPHRMPEVKVPKKRGRPRRNPLPPGLAHPPPQMLVPLSLDDGHQMQQPPVPHFPENERPKRTCRNQKSYAPPKRGRGRGRGKRKLDAVDPQVAKKPKIEQDLTAIEASTTAVIPVEPPSMRQGSFGKSPELYKALKQPTMDAVAANSTGPVNAHVEANNAAEMRLPRPVSNQSKDSAKDKKLPEPVEKLSPEKNQRSSAKEDSSKSMENVKLENKDILVPPGHPNWLTPVSKRASEAATKQENVSTVQVIDEETRMSAESGSRSQTPARNISAPASENIVNEESQGSVLSTATTESEKVKVKNRRMEINFDPDEGPFTVDKIAEYEWPLDRKGETFMIQEQISQYLGVKSFKRKYPDLKRRVVDMEERNYLRENGLVSEAMCDMGLTAVCSSEVLDVMCSDFPDQYEEYRKHMREKQVKEHSKKQKELTAAANAEKNRIDLAEMAVQSALSWNISLNKARRENRKCSLDLQTFTIHVPKKQQKVEAERRIGHYPVALIPGQYTDYYREYTPAELRYYPLNTVLYGPMRPNERKFDSQSEGSQSDSDSDSSSDDSSSSSSEGTQDTEGSQSTMDEVDMEIASQKEEVKLKCKMCLKALNKSSKNEVLIQCGTCNGHVHPSCIDLTLDMVPHIQSYAWQCTDCKTCAQCHDPADEDKMLFCDMCDRGYHIYCVGLRRVPQGRWHCQECAVCANCGSREPGGISSDRNSVAQWQHEYKKGDKNTRVYVSTLCVPCSKLWRKGRYCPHCSRCHTAPRLDLEANLVHCSACDKYLHLGCVETKGVPLDRKNYLCDFCAPNRQQVVKPLVSKALKT